MTRVNILAEGEVPEPNMCERGGGGCLHCAVGVTVAKYLHDNPGAGADGAQMITDLLQVVAELIASSGQTNVAELILQTQVRLHERVVVTVKAFSDAHVHSHDVQGSRVTQ